MELRPGLIVNIYHDPITCRKLEGRAVLDEPADDDGGSLPMWWVVFQGDEPDFTVPRTVNPYTACPE